MVSRPDIGKKLNLTIDIIPKNRSNRPERNIAPKYLTIHNTGNNNYGADALAHGRFIKNPETRVSWHYTVDDRCCIKHLPIDEMGYHAGTQQGNNTSIGIEICMNQGINQSAANERAATLAAILMYDLNLSINQVVPHYYWGEKNCPQLLLENGKPGQIWQKFLEQIQAIYETIEPTTAMIKMIFPDETYLMEEDLESPNPCTTVSNTHKTIERFPYLSQMDNEYEPYTACNVTSLAMCLQYFGIRGRTHRQLEDEIYQRAIDRSWSRFTPQGLKALAESYPNIKDDLTMTGTLADIRRAIDQGKPCIVHGFFTEAGHIIVIKGYTPTGFIVNDSYGEWYPWYYDKNTPRVFDNKGENKHYSKRAIAACCDSWSLGEAKIRYPGMTSNEAESANSIWLHRIYQI